VAISVDSPADSLALAQKLSIGFALLSDPDLSVITAWGVAMDGKDIAVPATFIVRADGKIEYAYIGETQADRPAPADILKLAAALK
jgi:peroxiredoxin